VDDASTDPGTLSVLEDIKSALQHTGKLRFMRRASREVLLRQPTMPWLSLARLMSLSSTRRSAARRCPARNRVGAETGSAYRLIYTDSTMIDQAGRLLHVYANRTGRRKPCVI